MTQAPSVWQAVDPEPAAPWPHPGWTAIPLSIRTDAEHGGRWTSLSAGGREWLWRNSDAGVVAARKRVHPGTAFVDAGGVEECLPTINGLPDHGSVWSVPWDSQDGADVVVAGDLTLHRTITAAAGTVLVTYAISGPPGTPFVHAVHALLDLGPQTTLMIPRPQDSVVFDEAGSGGQPVSWPPLVAGIPADRLGPDDGTAVAVLVPGCHEVVMIDGTDALRFRWWLLDVGADDPCSLLVWRNLGGWPAGAPYRSVGIEPMVGRTTTVPTAPTAPTIPAGHEPQQAAAAGAVRIPPSAGIGWQLDLTAWRSAN